MLAVLIHVYNYGAGEQLVVHRSDGVIAPPAVDTSNNSINGVQVFLPDFLYLLSYRAKRDGFGVMKSVPVPLPPLMTMTNPASGSSKPVR